MSLFHTFNFKPIRWPFHIFGLIIFIEDYEGIIEADPFSLVRKEKMNAKEIWTHILGKQRLPFYLCAARIVHEAR